MKELSPREILELQPGKPDSWAGFVTLGAPDTAVVKRREPEANNVATVNGAEGDAVSTNDEFAVGQSELSAEDLARGAAPIVATEVVIDTEIL